MKENSLRVYQTGRKERVFYCLFFLGQNILWGYAGFMETFLTDIGIAAATAAAILLVPKLWDAFNDVLFGYLVDRHKFKNGQKFVPWIRIGTAALSITTVAMFAVPEGLAQPQKIAWFMVSYVLFDISYTIQDTPVFALTTVMTSDVEERSAIIAGGYVAVMDYWYDSSERGIGNKNSLISFLERYKADPMEGAWKYWEMALTEEACDLLRVYNQEKGYIISHMRHCPSRGMLNSLEHVEPYHDYCQHCNVIYWPKLQPFLL